MIRIIVLLVILVYLGKTLTKFDRVKDKVYQLPKLLLGTAVAFIIAFFVMTIMEKSGIRWMYDWAGVAAAVAFTWGIHLLMQMAIRKNQ
jgi:branched-subunit amino acid ABC-type transport system permease component